MAFLRRGGNDGPLLLTVCGLGGQQLRIAPDNNTIKLEQQQQQQQHSAQNKTVSQQQQQPAQQYTTTYTFRVEQPAPQAMSMPVLTSPNNHHPQQIVYQQPRQTRSAGGKLPGWQMKLRSERASPTKTASGKGKKHVPVVQQTRTSSRRAGGRRR